MKFTCKVCNQKFEDGWQHVLKWNEGSQGFGTPKDLDHDLAEREFRAKLWDGDCPFCGSKVNKFSSGKGDDVSWEIVCSGCQFLFDED